MRHPQLQPALAGTVAATICRCCNAEDSVSGPSRPGCIQISSDIRLLLTPKICRQIGHSALDCSLRR